MQSPLPDSRALEEEVLVLARDGTACWGIDARLGGDSIRADRDRPVTEDTTTRGCRGVSRFPCRPAAGHGRGGGTGGESAGGPSGGGGTPTHCQAESRGSWVSECRVTAYLTKVREDGSSPWIERACHPVEREVCLRPGLGYAAPRDSRPGSAWGPHGTSAESPPVRRGPAAGPRGIWDPAAPRRGEPPRHEPRRGMRDWNRSEPGIESVHAEPSRTSTRTSSAKAPISGRGSMTSRHSARAGRPVSREPDSQPRSPGGVLRTVGASERRAAVRGIPSTYPADVSPPTALDSR